MAQSLWDFSVALYARPGVAELCLRLQDDEGADVCLLLAALWLEQRGVPATSARAAQLERLARPWQQTVTAPLRQLRCNWKAAAAADRELHELRRQLAAVELQAERLLLERLETLAAGWPTHDADDTPGAGAWLEYLEPGADGARQQLRAAAGMPTQP